MYAEAYRVSFDEAPDLLEEDIAEVSGGVRREGCAARQQVRLRKTRSLPGELHVSNQGLGSQSLGPVPVHRPSVTVYWVSMPVHWIATVGHRLPKTQNPSARRFGGEEAKSAEARFRDALPHGIGDHLRVRKQSVERLFNRW